MTTVYADIETRSRVDLRKSNVYRYAADPDFRILMMAYAVDDGPVELVLDESDMRRIVEGWIAGGHTIVAQNSSFERVCFSRLLGLGAGAYIDPELFDDPMPLAAEHGFPMKLESMARWLGGEQKDEAGAHLIRYFCSPARDGGFRTPEDSPERWDLFKSYNVQDVETLRSVYQALPGWPTPGERAAWILDQRINDRGIAVDVPMARAAVDAAEANHLEQSAEFTALTGVHNPGSTSQVMAWFEGRGMALPNLQKATVDAVLASTAPGPTERRALELRQDLALVASKKYIAALDRVDSDGRLRGSFQFFGAHTGRWAGRGVQLQNLPSATVETLEGASVDSSIGAAALDLTLGLGGDANTLKAMVRSMFTGPFTVVDYSAIEARVLAWIAGEQWAIEAFAAGRDIYVETAKRMGGLSRREGKVATLALGYNGGVNSLRAMGAEGEDEDLQALVTSWREANEHITALWTDLEQAFWTGGDAGERLRVEVVGDSRRIVLPSGRAVTYHAVRREWGVNRWGKRAPQLSFRDPKRGGARVETYGGRLTENCLAGDSEVLTERGWVRLDSVPADVRVWDGIEWVNHEGVHSSGVHQTVTVDGVRMTPDHRILTTEGWNSASSSEGLHRAPVELQRDRGNDAAVPTVAGGGRIGPVYSSRRSEPVYDLVNCGPRSRFVVLASGGPMIVHNCTQAIARDVLADALLALDDEGFPVAGHVHDEVIVEGLHDIDTVAEVMTTASDWTEGLPLDAEGYQCPRYRKG